MEMKNSNPLVYLNTAGCGLISDMANNAAFELYQKFSTNSSGAAEYWRDHETQRIREVIADFVGASSNNIALIPNFSYGANAVIQSLKGDEKILLYKKDYPSFTAPFIINKFIIEWFDDKDDFILDLEYIESILHDKDINVFAISQVQYLSGFKIDLEAVSNLCKKYGILLMVDATQSLGAFPIDVSKIDIDVLIASNYKWMNAGFGTGILYLSSDFLKKYPPVIGGHHDIILTTSGWDFRTSILSYEPGHINMTGFSILDHAINEKNKIGLENIEINNGQLTAKLLKLMEPLPVKLIGGYSLDHRSSIVVIRDESGLGDWLRQHQIIVTSRNNCLRISIHFHNSEADILSCIRVLTEFYATKE